MWRMRDSPTGASGHRTRAIAAVLLLMGAPLGAQQATGTVTGTVRSTDGGTLPTAIVMVSGTARGSNVRSDGTYRIVLPVGRYELRARLLGFVASRESVTVAAGETLTRDFRLARAATNLEAVAIIGTRGQERTVVSAPVPIDVLNAAEIRETGRTETAQMIQAVAPSVNFPRTSVGDGTDHMRPATLRGLAPDQTLVLINGKRRHAGALVNLNAFVGRGSQPVDLNAIPASMIERIEVLLTARRRSTAPTRSPACSTSFSRRGDPERSRPPPDSTSRPTTARTTSRGRRSTRASARSPTASRPSSPSTRARPSARPATSSAASRCVIG